MTTGQVWVFNLDGISEIDYTLVLNMATVNPERFRGLVRDPSRTRQDLEQMMRNAIAKGESELARIAKDALDSRFPGWDTVRHKAAGARLNVAHFHGTKKHFDTSKEGYIWLLERFIGVKPKLFETINWETVFVTKGRKRNYFGKNLKTMFHGSPHLADDRNNYARLTNGWYANTNLNNAQKFDILCRFAAIAKLEYDKDWRWDVEDPSDELRAHEARRALAERLLDELGKNLGAE